MRVWREFADVPDDELRATRTVVTIGNFDGMHLGHQHVVARAHEVSGEISVGTVVAVTFDPHPIAVLRPEHAPSTITTIDQRLRLMADAAAASGARLEVASGTGDGTHLRLSWPPS